MHHSGGGAKLASFITRFRPLLPARGSGSCANLPQASARLQANAAAQEANRTSSSARGAREREARLQDHAASARDLGDEVHICPASTPVSCPQGHSLLRSCAKPTKQQEYWESGAGAGRSRTGTGVRGARGGCRRSSVPALPRSSTPTASTAPLLQRGQRRTAGTSAQRPPRSRPPLLGRFLLRRPTPRTWTRRRHLPRHLG